MDETSCAITVSPKDSSAAALVPRCKKSLRVSFIVILPTRIRACPPRQKSLSADATVLNNSIVTVIGPTPPGTGVM